MNIRVPAWLAIRRIGQSKLLGLTIFIPVLGYMILFNGQLVQLFELSKDIFGATVDSEIVSHDNKTRLFYFYFGFTFLGVGSLTYQLFCPSVVKEHQSDREFVREELPLMTRKRIEETLDYLQMKVHQDHFAEIRDIRTNLINAQLMNQEASEKARLSYVKELMLIQWQYENWSSTTARGFIFGFYLFGFLVLAIPTVDMFIKVIVAFFH